MKSAPALSQTAIRRFVDGYVAEASSDVLAVEEPLEIRVGFSRDGRADHRAISITMRTPGGDTELAAGFLFTEGILNLPNQIRQIRHCGKFGVPDLAGRSAGEEPAKAGTPNRNTIRVDLQDGVEVDLKRLERHFYTSSSCGVCGKSSIQALQTGAEKIASCDEPKIDCEVIHRLPAALLAAQETFEKTGGLHASALFETDGTLDIVREDVGRHNALDKVIGAKFLENRLPLSDRVLLVSGRASFELVQKALMAGIPILAAVGAPSSLAVELAREFGMTLVGFVRDNRFNVYCGEQRILAKSQ